MTSLLRDLTISEKQKQVLIEIYQSFRHENELEDTGDATTATAARKVAALRQTKITAPKRAARAKTKPKAKPKAKRAKAKPAKAATKKSKTTKKKKKK